MLCTHRINRRVYEVPWLFHDQTRSADIPPSMAWICPVIQEDLSESKNSAKLATSSAAPMRFSGCLWALASIFSGEDNNALASGVWVMEGAMQFTLILGANSAANARVKPSSAPLELETKV